MLVRAFYSNAKLLTRGTEVIGTKSYLMGKTLTLDLSLIATHLGLLNEGVSDEATAF